MLRAVPFSFDEIPDLIHGINWKSFWYRKGLEEAVKQISLIMPKFNWNESGMWTPNIRKQDQIQLQNVVTSLCNEAVTINNKHLNKQNQERKS